MSRNWNGTRERLARLDFWFSFAVLLYAANLIGWMVYIVARLIREGA